MTGTKRSKMTVKERKRHMFRKVEPEELGRTLAKLYPGEGMFHNELKFTAREPWVPETPPNTSLRQNYVENSIIFHYPRPIIDSYTTEDALKEIFGDARVTPLSLFKGFAHWHGFDIDNERPSVETWIRIAEAAEATYPMMYLRCILKESPEEIAKDLTDLWDYLIARDPNGYTFGPGLMYIPDYYGDEFTIKEGLILQLMGDMLGVLVYRQSEDPQGHSDDE